MANSAPSVLWAQRPNLVFLTICLEDCQNPTIKIEPDSIYFQGVGGTDKKVYELTVDLYEPIKPDNSLHKVRERNIEFCLKKEKESGPYWPRLTKSKDKKHWLKVDFNKWKDEDESDDEQGGGGGPGGFGGFGGGGDNDFEEMMRNMGGLGGGLGGAGGDKPSMDEFGGHETDSDDDEGGDLPDLE